MPRELPDPGYASDDGSPDPAVRALLAAAADQPPGDPADPRREHELVALLAAARLLVPVMATGPQAGPEAGRQEVTAMALPLLLAADGRRALPVFTGSDALTAWRADARPVPVSGQRAAYSALAEGHDALLLDVAGPTPYLLTGPALRALAEGRQLLFPRDDPDVLAALAAAVAADPAVQAAYAAPAERADLLLTLVLSRDAEPVTTARAVAERLRDNVVLRARLGRGVDIAVLTPGGTPAGQLLHRRGDANP